VCPVQEAIDLHYSHSESGYGLPLKKPEIKPLPSIPYLVTSGPTLADLKDKIKLFIPDRKLFIRQLFGNGQAVKSSEGHRIRVLGTKGVGQARSRKEVRCFKCRGNGHIARVCKRSLDVRVMCDEEIRNYFLRLYLEEQVKLLQDKERKGLPVGNRYDKLPVEAGEEEDNNEDVTADAGPALVAPVVSLGGKENGKQREDPVEEIPDKILIRTARPAREIKLPITLKSLHDN